MNNKIMLLIDGDVLAFRTAAAAEKRDIIVEHKPSGIVKDFKNRTEFRKIMKEKGKEITDAYLISDRQLPDTIENCTRSIAIQIKKVLDFVEPDEYYIFVGGDTNFRNDLPLPWQYKSGRKETIRPILLRESKDFLINSYNAVVSDGIEADDELNIWAYAAIAKGYDAIICTVDKDANQADGVYILNPTADKFELKFMPKVGRLFVNDKGDVKGEGLLFGMFQWLNGDPSDEYKPTDVLDIKYGQISAYNALKDCTDLQQGLDAVVKQYKEWFPEPFEYKSWDGRDTQATWRSMMQLYFKCWYMKRTYDDPSDWQAFFKSIGLEVDYD